LPRVLTALGVNARSRQRLQVPLTLRGIDNVHGAIASGEPFPDKRQHHLVKLIVGVKERTGMTAAADFATGQTNSSR
jgi:hypothetical protein